jgi:ribosomal protein S30
VRQIAFRCRKVRRGWNTSARNVGKYKRRCERSAPAIGAPGLTPDFLAGPPRRLRQLVSFGGHVREGCRVVPARTIAACLDRARRRRRWGVRIP